MLRKIVSGLVLTMLLMGMLTLAFNLQKTQANPIRANESVDPEYNKKHRIEKRLHVEFPTLKIEEAGNYCNLRMDKCSYISEPGHPRLPVRSVTLKLPLYTNVSEVAVSINSTFSMSLEKTVSPAPPPIPLVNEMDYLTNSSGETQPKSSIYNESELYPEEWFSYSVKKGLDPNTDTRIQSIYILLYPVRYFPLDNKIVVAEEAAVVIYYEDPAPVQSASSELENLIITSPTLEDQAVRLAAFKNSTGISSRVVNTLWIYINYPGVDHPEQVRNCIKDFVSQHNILYVTIFGDADQVPVRYAYVPDGTETDVATDLYYADLDGTWDDNRDGLYADLRYDNVDGVPDVYVGRIPPSLVEYAEAVVNKIMNFTQNFNIGQAWANRAVLSAGTGNGLGSATTVLNEYIANMISDMSLVKLYASSGNLTNANLKSEINDGCFFLNFAGHGNPDSWMLRWIIWPFWWEGFSWSDADALINELKLPVITTMSCSTSRFDDAECIGERFVLNPNGGSIAYFGATRIAWGYIDEWAPDGLMGEMDWRIYEAFYDGYSVLGQMWGVSIERFVQIHPLDVMFTDEHGNPIGYLNEKTVMEFVLLGDPTLSISRIVTQTSLYVDPSCVDKDVGETFSINVSVAKVLDLYAYEIWLYYDTSILDGIDVELPSDHFLKPEDPGNIFIVELTVIDDFNATHGCVRAAVTLLTGEPGKSGGGTLFRIIFLAVTEGVSVLNLDETYNHLFNSNVELIPHSTEDGLVSVPSAHYEITIEAYDINESASVSVSFTWDEASYTTPETFADLTGSHEVVVAAEDEYGHPFVKWFKDWIPYSTDNAITVSSGGVYTAVYAAPATVHVEPSSLTRNVSEDFSVNVSIVYVVDLAGWEFQLYYNSSVISALDTLEGPFLKSVRSTKYIEVDVNNNHNVTHGRVYLACALLGSGPGASGSGTLATITFKAIGEGQSALNLPENQTKLVDSSQPYPQTIPHTTVDGKVVVVPTTIVYLDPSEVVGPPPNIGDTFTLTLRIGAVENLYAWTVDITWDPTILEYVSVSEGDCLKSAGTTLFLTGAVTSGKIEGMMCTLMGDPSIYCVDVPPAPNDLANVTFNVLDYTGTVGTWINITGSRLTSCAATDIPHTVENAKLTLIPCDLVVSEVELPYTEAKLYANITYDIGVNVTNLGIGSASAFNVSLELYWVKGGVVDYYAEQRVLELGSGASTTVNFRVEITHCREYVLNATVDCHDEVAESDETNNSMMMNVEGRIPGDVNGDMKVDFDDIVIMCMAYLSTPIEPNWNEQADLNADGKVDFEDIVIVCMHYLKSCPP